MVLSHLCEPGSVNNHRRSTKRLCAVRSGKCCFIVGARALGASSSQLCHSLSVSISFLSAQCCQVSCCCLTGGMCSPKGWSLAEGSGALCRGFPAHVNRLVPHNCILLLVGSSALCLHWSHAPPAVPGGTGVLGKAD